MILVLFEYSSQTFFIWLFSFYIFYLYKLSKTSKPCWHCNQQVILLLGYINLFLSTKIIKMNSLNEKNHKNNLISKRQKLY